MPENYTDAMYNHCLSEVVRLGSQDFFRADDALVKDLAEALAHCADNEEHATRMITAWKASTRAMLHESDLVSLADSTEIRDELMAGCGRCLGTDFIVIERKGYSGVKRCSCARGRQLAKMDQAKRSPSAQSFDFAKHFTQEVESDPEPDPPKLEPARKRSTRPPQVITAQEVDRVRAAEMERRRKKDTIQ